MSESTESEFKTIDFQTKYGFPIMFVIMHILLVLLSWMRLMPDFFGIMDSSVIDSREKIIIFSAIMILVFWATLYIITTNAFERIDKHKQALQQNPQMKNENLNEYQNRIRHLEIEKALVRIQKSTFNIINRILILSTGITSFIWFVYPDLSQLEPMITFLGLYAAFTVYLINRIPFDEVLNEQEND